MIKRFSIVAALVFLIVGCGNGHSGHAETYLPQPMAPREVTVTTGRPGDHWLDTMQFVRVARAKRAGKWGYEVAYEGLGGTTFTLFWSRDQIDFRGDAPQRYQLRNMPLGQGHQVRFPTKVTSISLPYVHRSILLLEGHYGRYADGEISWAQAMADVAVMGITGPGGPAGGPPARIPPARVVVPSAAKAAAPSAKELARALEAAGHVRPAGAAAHHIVAGSAEAARPARGVLQRFGIGINDAANGVFLPATRTAPNPTGAAVHSTLHTEFYYRTVNEALSDVTTRQAALDVLEGLRQWLLRGGH